MLACVCESEVAPPFPNVGGSFNREGDFTLAWDTPACLWKLQNVKTKVLILKLNV